MKLKILIENTVFQAEAKAELGFSLYIESNDGKRILFDTGQTGLFADNAQLFGIDLNTIDALVLSHGHYDHTGGVARFLSLNNHASIYAKQGFDGNKYGRGSRYIGLPQGTYIPSDRLVIVDQPTEIAEGIFIMPDIHLFDQKETHFSNLNIKTGDSFEVDIFNDEQYLAILHNDKLSIVSGCAHRGIVNTILSARQHFKQPLELVMGGFHTLHEDSNTIHALAQKLNELGIERIVACHCTGINQYAQLKSEYNGTIEHGHVGLNTFL